MTLEFYTPKLFFPWKLTLYLQFQRDRSHKRTVKECNPNSFYHWHHGLAPKEPSLEQCRPYQQHSICWPLDLRRWPWCFSRQISQLHQQQKRASTRGFWIDIFYCTILWDFLLASTIIVLLMKQKLYPLFIHKKSSGRTLHLYCYLSFTHALNGHLSWYMKK